MRKIWVRLRSCPLTAKCTHMEDIMFAHKKMQVAFVLATVSLSLPTFADAPSEGYHVAYKDISKEVLRNTIGILTINSRAGKEATLQTYAREAGQYVPAALLEAADTTPISSFGYHPPVDSGTIENYRYPIIEATDSYVRIVYDPVKNLSGWINLIETGKRFSTSVTMLHDLEALKSFSIDIFSFTESGKRKFYKFPGTPDNHFLVEKSDISYWFLTVMDMRKGYLQLGKPRFNDSTLELEGVDPIGWIRIRDDQGLLTFWIMLVDMC